MPTIFEKLPASGERCIILEPREQLVYKFDLGDYSEIRMGAFLSAVGTGQSNNNLIGTDETISAQSALTTQFAFGFTRVTGENHIPSLPRSSDSFFLGNVNNTGNGVLLEYSTLRIRDQPNSLSLYFITGNSGIAFDNSTSARLMIASQPSGNTAYSRFNGYKLEIVNNTFSLTKAAENSTETTNVSVPNLRNLLLNQTYTFSTDGISGFYTNDRTSSGVALPKPNAIYVYSPFLNNRLRIHTLLIERYA